MNSETMMRDIAILTESGRWVGPEADTEPYETGGPLEGLLSDLLRFEVPVHPDATPAEVADAVSQELSPRFTSIVAAFAAAFHQLALEHDSLDPETTSADVLRELAVRANQPGFSDD